MYLGIDIGSTTIKCALLEDEKLLYQSYQRHNCQVREAMINLLITLKNKYHIQDIKLAISGSAGMGLAQELSIPFIQEVYATRIAANKFLDEPDCIIELGGEDAKILFLSNGLEVRMNGTCAGGTGAFIDQMAQLMNVDVQELNELAKKHQKQYTIASRCGVFAKSDIQPLINQGASKEDLAFSIYKAVANQTISGLAQGRKIIGKVVYLGGPLTFNSELRKAFDESLDIEGIFPQNSLYFVALGTALMALKEESINLDALINKLNNSKNNENYRFLKALFKSEKEYQEFSDRHKQARVNILDTKNIDGKVFLGIDAGSTTLKMVLINEQQEIVYSNYQSNKGNTLKLVLNNLKKLYEENPHIQIISSCATGYGEELIKSAFKLDMGVVETMAHFTAAKKFMPNVDFIIDIGGQDIKCFKINNGSIENLFLNEACSSGCGSFLQTFASALKYDIKDFAKLALFASHPVDLGTRCTVFMNSLVKQAQKDGATIEDISAGLAISVVKNALYKVIRTNADQLGKNIVVQGGTFYNDAVLRAFEMELGTNVTRPNIAGLMGAYGAALYAQENTKATSSILTYDDLCHFENKTKQVNCGLCSNHCLLTIHEFSDKARYISGNRCQRPISNKRNSDDLNIYEYKRSLLKAIKSSTNTKRGKIGIPMALNMYELYPFWHRFFSELGFEVVTDFNNNMEEYHKVSSSIPSDTICFPAKLAHVAINNLLKQNLPYIFYPCMTYNIKEPNTNNNFNCPVVAYYPEVLDANMQDLKQTTFISPFISIVNHQLFPAKIFKVLKPYFNDLHYHEVLHASKCAYKTYDKHLANIHTKGQEIITKANLLDKEIIVLAGRPYHIDPLINHGIDKLLTSLDVAIISEDCIDHPYAKNSLNILNQWSYHSRLFAAAHFVKDHENTNLVQLVSFGCGIDAITTDEVKSILESHNKIYTQLKIDEITNLGAIKIRLRSLLTALEQKGEKNER